jgi:uncharacterized metal-binding protein YceD (DUF177 family)
MDSLIPYSIPVRGLRVGTHQFDFQIDREFFRRFEESPVADGQIQVHFMLDKRPDMLVLHFQLAGTVKTDCDRCLAPIDLPIANAQSLIVKFSETEEAEDADVVYVHPEIQQLNIARYIYEYIILAMPIIKVYDCFSEANRPCNLEMLQYLSSENSEPQAAPESNPIWEELKKLNKN